jgi:hypothetical protein
MPNYNHAAAFAAFCKGSTIEDISLALAIPVDTIAKWARDEAWKRLARELETSAALVPVSTERAERDLAKIEENRAAHYEIAARLRGHVDELTKKLVAGTLEFTIVTPKGQVLKTPPTLRMLRDLASYARTVQEIAAVALGDTKREGEGAGAAAGAQPIMLVMPEALAKPRQERGYDASSEAGPILDLKPLPTEGNSSKDVSDYGP